MEFFSPGVANIDDLIQLGLLERSPRGRKITFAGRRHIDPEGAVSVQRSLFDE